MIDMQQELVFDFIQTKFLLIRLFDLSRLLLKTGISLVERFIFRRYILLHQPQHSVLYGCLSNGKDLSHYEQYQQDSRPNTHTNLHTSSIAHIFCISKQAYNCWHEEVWQKRTPEGKALVYLLRKLGREGSIGR